ncbi:molybdenum cofactor guanylyltransferase [Campylobacter sp. MIT 12-8780]|uniref:molybdenum cofactor guanylyltransferase n=1 Tax=Campylobacter sp. MIT 12-8780 TaxID=2202200 RepID=UPI00115F3B15|nr:molybdenum cofactor guanylyltransferase [Campylobacter sp. MIT 12-8780]TQR42425.1 molybdenum cofactor guanylyltransferase [Campylobacter sp. MIT 12-8780]
MHFDLQTLPCVILCGGKSSRMGQDKCFLPFHNQSLIEFQFSRLSRLFQSCFLSCKEDKFKAHFKQLIFDKKLEGVEFSPMLALFSVLDYFKDTFVFVISVDMPSIEKEHITTLAKHLDQSLIILPRSKGYIHALCGFYHSSLSSKCLEFLKQKKHKIQSLCEQNDAFVLDFKDDEAFVNLNDFESYVRFKNEMF